MVLSQHLAIPKRTRRYDDEQMIYGQKPEIIWARLLTNKCPRCNSPLDEKEMGLVCMLNNWRSRFTCAFFIKHETAKKLIRKMRDEQRRVRG